jgi:hypothetical protein
MPDLAPTPHPRLDGRQAAGRGQSARCTQQVSRHSRTCNPGTVLNASHATSKACQ